MKLIFSKKQRTPALNNRQKLLKAIKISLKKSGLYDDSMRRFKEHAEIHVLLVNSREITEINENFLNHQGDTDVIAFDLRDEIIDVGDEAVVAEIYVCLDVAMRAAKEFETSIEYEVILYITHGFLHLMGGDDYTTAGAKKMRQGEKIVMSEITRKMSLLNIFSRKRI